MAGPSIPIRLLPSICHYPWKHHGLPGTPCLILLLHQWHSHPACYPLPDYSTLHILFTRTTWCLAGAPNPFWTTTAWEFPTILTLEQCLLEAWELTLHLLYVKEFNYAISLPPFSIINVVLFSVILLHLESEQSTFYTNNPLPTSLPQVYWAATMFSNSSLTVNISQSLLTDRDNTVSRSSPQGEDSNTTLVPTIPSTPTVPSTPAIVPPSGPPSPRSPSISHSLR